MRILVLLLFPLMALADVQVVQKGFYEVVVDGEVVSQHSSYRKALQSAVNDNGLEALITSPDILVTKDTRDIVLSWEAPTTRVDGQTLEGPLTYRVLIDEESYDVLSSPVVVNAPAGERAYSVVAIDSDGLESKPSNQVME